MLRPLAAALALAWSLNALAHDLWVEPEDGGYRLLQGHLHSSEHGAEQAHYQPEQVLEAVCYGTDGKPTAVAPTTTHPVSLPGPCAAVWFLFSTGYWTKTPLGTKNLPKNEAKHPLDSWRSEESVKYLETWSEAFARPLGQGLEIVPLKDPTKAEIGDKLHLLVSFEGKPLAGAKVSYDEGHHAETGPDGQIHVRLRHGGLQQIHASLTQASDSPQADRIVRTTILQLGRAQ